MNANDDGSTIEPAPGPAPGLTLEPNIDDGDGFYDELLKAHEGLDEAASHALNARLVLVLCNHVGDRRILREALAVARAAATDATARRSTD